jgi:hypothetical protein
MRFRRKPIVAILTGAIVGTVTVCEGRENSHTELRRYEEPSVLSYELSQSTATITTGMSIFGAFGGGWRK